MKTQIFNDKLRNYLKNFAKVFSIDFLSKASRILLLPIFLKFMTQEEFGAFGYILGILGFFAGIASLGIYGGLNKFFYDNEFQKEELITSSLLILLVSYIFFALLTISTVNIWRNFFFKVNVSNYIVFGLCLFFVYIVLNQFLMGYYFISKDYSSIQSLNLSRLIIVNTIVIFFIYIIDGNTTIVRFYALCLSEIVINIFYLKKLLKYYNFKKFSWKLSKRLLKIGVPVAFNGIIGFLYTFSDRYVLQQIQGFKSVGNYNFAIIVASVMMMIFSIIQNLWLPYFFSETNIKKRNSKLKQVILLLILLCILYIFSVYIGLLFLFHINVFDPSYKTSLKFLWILILANSFQAISALFNNYFALFEATYFGIIISFFLAGLNIILNYQLIPLYGNLGASISTCITAFTSIFLGVLIVKYLERRNLNVDR